MAWNKAKTGAAGALNGRSGGEVGWRRLIRRLRRPPTRSFAWPRRCPYIYRCTKSSRSSAKSLRPAGALPRPVSAAVKAPVEKISQRIFSQNWLTIFDETGQRGVADFGYAGPMLRTLSNILSDLRNEAVVAVFDAVVDFVIAYTEHRQRVAQRRGDA